MQKRLQLHIYGKVQGVWYRGSTKHKAEELNLSGFVENRADGSVYGEIEGPEESLEAMVAWCREGPELARVTEIKIEEMNPLNDEGFKVNR